MSTKMTLVIGVGVDHAVRLTGRKFRLNERRLQALRARWEAL